MILMPWYDDSVFLAKFLAKQPPLYWRFLRWKKQPRRSLLALARSKVRRHYGVEVTDEQFKLLGHVERGVGMCAIYAVHLTKSQYQQMLGIQADNVAEYRFFSFKELETLPDFRDKDREMIRSLMK